MIVARSLERPLAVAFALALGASPVACRRDSSVASSPAIGAGTGEAAPAVAGGGAPCGDLGCMQFESAADAMRFAIAGDARVVAIGEAHAPLGTRVPSAAHRFTEELMPLLAGRASDLLVELMMPPEGCAVATAETRERQAPATTQQAPTNQNEYVTMGERARALGTVPDMLRPSCADLDGVRDAGDGAIEASLSMIARLSTAQAGRLVDRDARSDADREKVVVIYGGMLHNDLDPPPDRRAWSYAPALDAKAGGRFVAIDLVVPEFIVDDATWRTFPWVSRYDRARLGGKTTLFRTGPRSFVLVFAATRDVPAPPGAK